jgi:hypothetical protein
MRQMLSTPLPRSRNRYDVLPVDVIEETSVSSRESELNVLDTPLAPATSLSDVCNVKLPSWERSLPRKYIVASTPGRNSLSIDVDIQCTESSIRRATQSLVDCGATGVFMDEQWVKDNGIVTKQLSRPIPVYNVDGSPNEAGPISEVATVVLCYNGHSERTSFAVTQLGKQSMILGYTWLRQHNPEVNWQTHEVVMSRCPASCDTHRVQVKKTHQIHRAEIQRIHACRSGGFPVMVEEVDDEEAPDHKGVEDLEGG